MAKRKPKKSDGEIIEKAFQLLKKFVHQHTEIEPTLWAGAFWSILVDGYNNSGVSYEQFSKEWNEVKHFYKPWFDQ